MTGHGSAAVRVWPSRARLGPALAGQVSGGRRAGQFVSARRPVSTCAMAAPRLPSGPLRLLLLVAACAAPLAAFPDGAPVDICIRREGEDLALKPNHPGNSTGISGHSGPFRVYRQNIGNGIRGEISGHMAVLDSSSPRLMWSPSAPQNS